MCAISLDSAYRWCHPCLSLIYFTQYDSLYYRPLFNWPEIKIANKNISKILRGVNLEGQNNSVFKGYLRCLSGKESSCQCKETQEMWVWSLGWEDPLEEEMAPHSSILAWEIPWTEEPGGLQSTGLLGVRHDNTHAQVSKSKSDKILKSLSRAMKVNDTKTERLRTQNVAIQPFMELPEWLLLTRPGAQKGAPTWGRHTV